LPDTEPISVPRHAPQASNAGAEPAPDPHDPGDVYGFLTSFTAGVQRGLDVSRPRDER
jgi:hypothetical protein